MKQQLIIFFMFVAVSANAQNWNVFNKNYRYNYKFDNSTLISNVLFTQYVSIVGSDTIYPLNGIGVEVGSSIVPNMPQFLMKKIVKKANGNVELQDTTYISIIPTCTLNQSWTFDTFYNLTATCVAISTVNIFNTLDSVRIILVNNTDSVTLSKQFGIIQFPKLYAQNKYYRLAGIEKEPIYDSVALFGEKVPNAWDFYDFNVGDQMCLNSYYIHMINTNSFVGNCKLITRVFNSKTILPMPNNGYSYNVLDVGRMRNSMNFWGDHLDCTSFGPSQPPITSTNTTIYFFGLHNAGLYENRMYPGQYNSDHNGLVKFGLDNNGTFYKYINSACQNTLYTILPNATLTSNYSGEMYGVGLGQIYRDGYVFEGAERTCVSCFLKGSTTYFGPFSGVGIIDNNKEQTLNFFPNPANAWVRLPIDLGTVKLFDPFGKLLKEEKLENKNTLNISELPNGLYFLEIQTDSFKSSQKLIIQH